MNSPVPSAKGPTASSAPAQRSFNWAEYIVIPIASCIMEAQPIALAFLFLPVFFLGVFPEAPVIDAGSTTLILLSLHWWALIVRSIVRRSGNEGLNNVLQLAGLLVVLIVVGALRLLSGGAIGDVIVPGAVTVWAWRRGVMWVRADRGDEQLITTFKVGFFVLVIILIITVLRFAQLTVDFEGLAPPVKDYMFTVLGQSLPLFFLSGLVALSFTRLEIIRRDNARNAFGGSRLDPTRTWRLVLIIVWAVLVAVSILFEVFALDPLRAVFIPVVSFLFAIYVGILYVIAYLLNFIFRPFTGSIPLPKSLPAPPIEAAHHLVKQQNQAVPPAVTFILFLISMIVVLAIMAIIVRAVLKRTKPAGEEEEGNEEEERERLSMNDILKARREERQQRKQEQEAFALEALDPTSARARYRELLLTTARNGSNQARRANETPEEYRQRLSATLRGATTQAEEGAPPDPAILAELTEAYTRERYGDKITEPQEKSFLGTWLPRLLQHIAGIGSSAQQTPSAPHARLPNKWGD